MKPTAPNHSRRRAALPGGAKSIGRLRPRPYAQSKARAREIGIGGRGGQGAIKGRTCSESIGRESGAPTAATAEKGRANGGMHT